MTNEDYWKEFSKRLILILGKGTFREEELNKEFFTELYISCSDFFKIAEGLVDLDLFWSDSIRSFLLKEKGTKLTCNLNLSSGLGTQPVIRWSGKKCLSASAVI